MTSLTEFFDRLIELAQEQASDDGENVEYDRALVELIGNAMSLPSEHWHVIARLVCDERSPLRAAERY